MYLKSLQIQGFKSFPDKIQLGFDQGLTAVVGPNGSGKSNIGDAVRWVLGEQSTKTLRGSKMEDVIFSGTASRKAMGFASVTLVIDNSEKTLIDFEEELSITRKLYRNGDSEYRINGKSVRLKDINELFMDTGLGRDGYSIIGQGRIAEIVGSKSNDRREIFEEAAGISKFRYRKLEAERKLHAAEENMLRLTDIVTELEDRIAPLKRQAEKAEIYLELASEERMLEISVWVAQIAELTEHIRNLSEQLLLTQANLEALERTIEQEEEKIQRGYRSMQIHSADAEDARTRATQLQRNSAELQAKIAVLANDIQHERTKAEQLDSQLSTHSKRVQELDNTLHFLEGACQRATLIYEHAKEQVEQTRIAYEGIESESKTAEDKSKQSDQSLHSLYLRQNEIQYELRLSKEKRDSLKAEQSRLDSEESECKQMLHDASTALAEIQEQIHTCQAELTKHREQTEQACHIVQINEQAKRKADQELAQCAYTLRDKKQRRHILHDLEQQLEGFSGSTKAIMRSELDGVHGSIAQLLTVESAYGIAIETALGASVQNIVVEDESVAKACIHYLANRRAGRATFLPLTTIRGRSLHEQGLSEQQGYVALACELVHYEPRYRSIVEFLLGRIVIAETIDHAAGIAKQYGFHFKVVTLDGQVVNAGGSFTGGSVQRNGGMLTRRSELQALDAEIARLTSEEESFRHTCQSLSEKLARAREEYKLQSDTLEQLRIQSEQLTLQVQRYQIPHNQARQQCETIARRRDELANSITSLLSEYTAIKEQEEQIAKQIQNQRQGVTDSTREEHRISEQLEQSSRSYQDSQLQLAQAQQDLELAKRDLAQHHQQREILGSEYETLLIQIAQAREHITGSEHTTQKMQVRLEEIRVDEERAREQARKYAQLHDEESVAIRELQSGMNAYHADRERLNARGITLEEKRHSLQAQGDRIVAQLHDIYGLTRSEAQTQAIPLEPHFQGRLQTIKQKIRALGNVNVEAVEEYKEVSERYRFLSEQMADVRKSKTELETLIEELTEEMRAIFTDSFAKINQNFQEIFVDLFEGGQAQLLLTDPDDVLHSGIEIKVSPPGKVIKNLISLSGGEQSFVAIAIYFAILKLRPAPFCILDEIDAALDEANVRKYARYLRHFTEHTQFVLVTHRRMAMEEANVLYGVTMQADGVSRLLKLEQPTDVEEVN